MREYATASLPMFKRITLSGLMSWKMSGKPISFRIPPSSGHLFFGGGFKSFKAHSLDLKLCCVLTSYHCLHIRSAQPDPVASLRPPGAPQLQKDS